VDEEVRRSMEAFKLEVRQDIEELRRELIQENQERKQTDLSQQHQAGTLERRETARQTDKDDAILALRKQVCAIIPMPLVPSKRNILLKRNFAEKNSKTK
jgi:hypothetical protein